MEAKNKLRESALDWMDNHLIYKLIQFLNLAETEHLVCLLLSRSRGSQLRSEDGFFNALCTSNYFLNESIISDKKPEGISSKVYFQQSIAKANFFRSTFQKLISCVPNSETFFTKLQEEKAFVSDGNQLNQILGIVQRGYQTIPRDVLLLYRILNGQGQLHNLSELFSTSIGLFGYISYYEQFYIFQFNEFLAPLCGFLGKLKALPFIKIYPKNRFYLDITNILKQPEASIYCFYPQNYAIGEYTIYIAHRSVDSFMRKMNSSHYDQQILLLHNYGQSSSDRTTNGIRIRVTAKHIYLDEHNSIDEFFYSYSVRISDENIPAGKRYRLTTRKWICTEDANPEEENIIQGPGVIGYYPEMFQGCDDFTYESCTVVKGRTGSMRGSFEFQEMGTKNDPFDAIIDPFPLRPDEDAKLISFNPETGQVQQIYPVLQ